MAHTENDMAKATIKNPMTDLIRRTIKTDGRSLYRLAIDTNLPYQTIHRFARGKREDLVMGTAWRLCDALGLELRPKRKG